METRWTAKKDIKGMAEKSRIQAFWLMHEHACFDATGRTSKYI